MVKLKPLPKRPAIAKLPKNTEEYLSIYQSPKTLSEKCLLNPLYYSGFYHNSDNELKRLIEMAEIAAYCHNLTPIKAFLWFLMDAADNALKRLVWRFLVFDSPPERSGREMVSAIAVRGGLK